MKKRGYTKEDKQPVACVELTMPPDIGILLDSKSNNHESRDIDNE
ncbi:hypothetical protein CT694_29690 (plasmid) [Bacillus wiedmannii bv. thuringiensis]|nr:hypothetical protein CT694_29690 [Bacillus wiedmannii bv. thuringiensis]